MEALWQISDLNIRFKTAAGIGYAVTDLSADIRANRVTVILGESGSGKSVLGSALIGLLPPNSLVSGSIRYKGRELLALKEREWDRLRGREIGWIAQSPHDALNPVYRSGELISEAAVRHARIVRSGRKRLAVRMLETVRLGAAVRRQYAFELSGGMAQRVLIAGGLSAEPPFLIMDEPTKGLDAPNVRQIADIVQRLSAEGKTLLIITHDIDFAASVADDIWVFYGSQLLESSPAGPFFEQPLHPYARGLLNATPARGLCPIPGESPSFYQKPAGCPFWARCTSAEPECRAEVGWHPVHPGRRVKCRRS